MKVSINAFGYVLLLITAGALLLQLIAAEAELSASRNYFDAVVNAVEDSRAAEGMLERCKREAGEKGYTLQFTRLGSSAAPLILVRLEYSLKLSLLGNASPIKGKIEGYAKP